MLLMEKLKVGLPINIQKIIVDEETKAFRVMMPLPAKSQLPKSLFKDNKVVYSDEEDTKIRTYAQSKEGEWLIELKNRKRAIGGTDLDESDDEATDN